MSEGQFWIVITVCVVVIGINIWEVWTMPK